MVLLARTIGRAVAGGIGTGALASATLLGAGRCSWVPAPQRWVTHRHHRPTARPPLVDFRSPCGAPDPTPLLPNGTGQWWSARSRNRYTSPRVRAGADSAPRALTQQPLR